MNNQNHEMKRGGAAFSVAPKVNSGLFLSLFALGAFFITADASGLGFTIAAMKAEPAPALIGLGLGLLSLGLISYRVGFALSPNGDVLIRWQGLLFPIRKTHIPVPERCTVGLSMKRTTRYNSGTDGDTTRTIITYEVSITSASGETTVCVLGTYLKGRRAAERLARLINANMLDVARGGESYREPESLDEPVGERYRRIGLAYAEPAEPPKGRISVKRCDDNTTQIAIAPTRITFSSLFIPLVISIIAAAGLTQQGDAIAAAVGFLTPQMVGAVALLIKVLIGLQIALLLFGKFRPANKVTITSDRVALTIASLWTRSMKAKDIEDVFGPPDDYAPSDLFPLGEGAPDAAEAPSGLGGAILRGMKSFMKMGVIVQGDRRSIALDKSLTGEEALWLKKAVLHRLIGE